MASLVILSTHRVALSRHAQKVAKNGRVQAFVYSEQQRVNIPLLKKHLAAEPSLSLHVLLVADRSSYLWLKPDHSPSTAALCHFLHAELSERPEFVVCPTSHGAAEKWQSQKTVANIREIFGAWAECKVSESQVLYSTDAQDVLATDVAIVDLSHSGEGSSDRDSQTQAATSRTPFRYFTIGASSILVLACFVSGYKFFNLHHELDTSNQQNQELQKENAQLKEKCRENKEKIRENVSLLAQNERLLKEKNSNNESLLAQNTELASKNEELTQKAWFLSSQQKKELKELREQNFSLKKDLEELREKLKEKDHELQVKRPCLASERKLDNVDTGTEC